MHMRRGIFGWLIDGGVAVMSGPRITVTSAPGFNASLLKVGGTLAAAYVAGNYTSPGGAITEGTVSFTVDGNARTGSYVLVAGDAVVTATPTLLMGGSLTGATVSSGAVPVTNTDPVATNGSGSVNVNAGSSSGVTVPATMAAPTLASTATRITVTKAADPADGGSSILSYDFRYSTDGGSTWTTVTGFTSPAVRTGFVPGTTGILVQERAVNAIGAGSWSTSATITMKVPLFLGTAFASGQGATYNIDLTTLDTTRGGAGGPILAGDVAFLSGGWASTGALTGNPGTDDAGWVEVFELFQDDTRDVRLSFSWKAMGGTPDTAIVCNGPNVAGSGSVYTVSLWRYIDPTSPFDVACVSAGGIDTGKPDPAAITPVSPGAVILAIGAGTGDTSPQILSARGDMMLSDSRANAGSARGYKVATQRKTDWTSGAFDPLNFDCGEDTTSESWAAVTAALKPY